MNTYEIKLKWPSDAGAFERFIGQTILIDDADDPHKRRATAKLVRVDARRGVLVVRPCGLIDR